MDDTVSDILRCEEQVRTTLHCDDKEKVPRLFPPEAFKSVRPD